MKKLLFTLLTILLFTACKKEIIPDKALEEIASAAAIKQTKFTVCHYDAVTGTSKTISVTQNALAGHLAHGDIQGDCSAVLTTICDQDWMVKNLDVDHYRNGDLIPQVTDPSAWVALTTGAWCYYNNDPANGAIYGKLYNWYAVNDPRGLAPSGWHVPSEAEWNELVTCIDPAANTTIQGVQSTTAGLAMNETGTTHWIGNYGATNSSHFTALPCGFLNSFFGSFNNIGYSGYWWTTTEGVPYTAWQHNLNNVGIVYRNMAPMDIGISVRCIRD